MPKINYHDHFTEMTCPICGKQFVIPGKWMYRHKGKALCSYTCYVQAGGDGGTDRLEGKKPRFYNNTKGAR